MKYTILKNWHYSFPVYPLLVLNNEIKRKIIIPKQAWFEKINVDDYDINKLFGVSFGLFGIHKNSFRIGWKPDFNIKGKIILYTYYYNNENKHTSKIIGYLYVEQTNTITIKWYKETNTFIVKLNNYVVFYEQLKIKQTSIKFFARPYHGGNNKSRCTYNVKLIKI